MEKLIELCLIFLNVKKGASNPFCLARIYSNLLVCAASLLLTFWHIFGRDDDDLVICFQNVCDEVSFIFLTFGYLILSANEKLQLKRSMRLNYTLETTIFHYNCIKSFWWEFAKKKRKSQKPTMATEWIHQNWWCDEWTELYNKYIPFVLCAFSKQKYFFSIWCHSNCCVFFSTDSFKTYFLLPLQRFLVLRFFSLSTLTYFQLFVFSSIECV